MLLELIIPGFLKPKPERRQSFSCCRLSMLTSSLNAFHLIIYKVLLTIKNFNYDASRQNHE